MTGKASARDESCRCPGRRRASAGPAGRPGADRTVEPSHPRRRLAALALLFGFLPALANAQTPPQAPQTSPFEPQLLRLSELMGALHYLRALCGFADAPAWRDRMNDLIDGQGLDQAGKERYAGAFNRGYRAYSETYRTCNEAAAKVIRDYLAESGTIIKDLDSRYGR